MTYKFTEDSYEQAVIQLFQTELDYIYQYGPDIERDPREVILPDLLETTLHQINPQAHPRAIAEAINKINTLDHPNFQEDNKTFHHMLTAGISVNYNDEGPKSDHIWLVDFKNPNNNGLPPI